MLLDRRRLELSRRSRRGGRRVPLLVRCRGFARGWRLVVGDTVVTAATFDLDGRYGGEVVVAVGDHRRAVLFALARGGCVPGDGHGGLDLVRGWRRIVVEGGRVVRGRCRRSVGLVEMAAVGGFVTAAGCVCG